jgi:signal transduction histidine kinase
MTYGLGLLLLALALLTRMLLDPILGDNVPLATVFLAVLFTTALGGWRPAVVVTILGFVGSTTLFIAPRLTLKSWDVVGVGRLGVYVISCGALISLVTRLRQAQQRHAASEARVIAILETMREGFLSVDAAWRIKSVNRSGERALGRSRAICLDRTLWESLPHLAGTPAETALRQAMRDQTTVQFETGAIAPPAWHAITATPVDRGLSIFLHDITTAKAHVDQLERQVGERTAALREVVSELEAFSYTLVHDMRAPLRSISSFAELLAVDHATQLDGEGRGYLERIRKAAARMDRLITSIMNYSQLARARPELRPVDLQHVAEDIIESEAGFHGDKADISIVGVLPVVHGNESLLTQCMSNLLHNATKFVAQGVKPQVRISARIAGEVARIEIADNGIGIAPEAAERIFEPFRREHPGYDGSGIGLAIVRKVVELMDGRVGLDSSAGAGSRFWFELRLATPASPIEPAPTRLFGVGPEA